MLAKSKESGYKQVCLSIDKQTLYLKFGFQEYRTGGNMAVMIKILCNSLGVLTGTQAARLHERESGREVLG